MTGMKSDAAEPHSRYWLQGQDLNLRSRGYEPRGITPSPPCLKLFPCHSGLSELLAACCGARAGGPAIVAKLPNHPRLGGERRHGGLHAVRRTSERKRRRLLEVHQPGASQRLVNGRASWEQVSCRVLLQRRSRRITRQAVGCINIGRPIFCERDDHRPMAIRNAGILPFVNGRARQVAAGLTALALDRRRASGVLYNLRYG